MIKQTITYTDYDGIERIEERYFKMIKNPVFDWIPIEAALPHRLERVLAVCYNYNNHMQTHVSLCTFWGKSSNGRLVWSGNKCVSHWMPLPELPKDFKQNPRLKEK